MINKRIEEEAQMHAAACSYYPCGATEEEMMAIERINRFAFIGGANFALSHQWVSVEDALPEDDRYFYLVADARLDPLGVDCAEYTCETKLFSRGGKILHPTHWCAIPPLNPEKEERCD